MYREVIGIVEDPQLKSNLLKFTLINNANDKIQVNIWDEELIKHHSNKLTPGNVSV